MISLDKGDALTFKQKLQVLMLPPAKRVWILKTLGRWEIANTRKRISSQTDVDGRKLAPRKSGKKKILRRMAKGLEPYVKKNTMLDLTWRNKQQARVAARHHVGQRQKMTAAQMARRFGTPDYSKPCPRTMAKKLRELGYMVAVKPKNKKGKKRHKKPSIKWIIENLSMGQAGAIIRQLSGTENPPTSWDVPLAERKILGTKEQAVVEKLQEILEEARK